MTALRYRRTYTIVHQSHFGMKQYSDHCPTQRRGGAEIS